MISFRFSMFTTGDEIKVYDAWLNDNCEGWGWASESGIWHYLNIEHAEDLLAFKLRFGL